MLSMYTRHRLLPISLLGVVLDARFSIRDKCLSIWGWPFLTGLSVFLFRPHISTVHYEEASKSILNTTMFAKYCPSTRWVAASLRSGRRGLRWPVLT